MTTPTQPERVPEPSEAPAPRVWPRLVGMVVFFVAVGAIGHATGLTEYLSQERIQGFMERLGVAGLLLYFVLFAVGELIHIPGIVFVVAALVAYGRVPGALAGYVGGLIAVSVAFVVVRALGGKALAEAKNPYIQRILAHLGERPLRTVALLRAVLWFAPALNYALAMSPVRYRDFLLGSAIGFVVPVVVLAVAYESVQSATAWLGGLF